MQIENRQTLQDKSRQTKKLQPILENNNTFNEIIYNYQKQHTHQFQDQITDQEQEDKILEGRDITICIRTRPLLPEEVNQKYFSIVHAHNPFFSIHNPKLDFKQNPILDTQKFIVDYSFGPNHSNEYIYNIIGPQLLSFSLEGGISTIFAYGQTGSGKTYTMQGIQQIIAQKIFEKNIHNHSIHVGFFELIGNKVNDLINENARMEIMEDMFGRVKAQGLQEYDVTNVQEFYKLIEQAQINRKTKTTFKNDMSSRTHSICQIRIQNVVSPQAEDGYIFLVDLVGSENASDSQFHDKQLMKETREINKSLMALKECLRNRVLAAKDIEKHVHIPFRNSKLTLLLKDTFDFDSIRPCKTVVIANVSPSIIDYQQSINTLRYAAPIRIDFNIKNRQIKKNLENPQFWCNQRIREYFTKRQIRKINFDKFIPYETGQQVLRMPMFEFISRLSEQGYPQENAKELHHSLWKYFIENRGCDRIRKWIRNEKQQKKVQIEDLSKMSKQDLITRDMEFGAQLMVNSLKSSNQFVPCQENESFEKAMARQKEMYKQYDEDLDKIYKLYKK